MSIANGAVVYRVAGRSYPYKSEPNCGVCRSPWRAYVENYLGAGVTLKKISQDMALFATVEERLSVAQIGLHRRKGHMPYEEEVRRKIIEKRLVELNIDPEEEADREIDAQSFLRLLINDAGQSLLRREKEPKLRDAIAAINLLNKMEDTSGPSAEDMAQGIIAIMKVVRANTTPQVYQNISVALSMDPIILTLMGKSVDAQAREVAAVTSP